jgi:hypothetical protein
LPEILTPAQLDEIERLHAQGASQQDIAMWAMNHAPVSYERLFSISVRAVADELIETMRQVEEQTR